MDDLRKDNPRSVDPIHVLTYGTLRVGEPNWAGFLSTRSQHLGTYTIDGYSLWTPHGGFPYAIPDPEGAIVTDLFLVSPEIFFALDRLEGYPTHYDRERVDLEGLKPWIYIAANPGMIRSNAVKIESGDWVEFRERLEDYIQQRRAGPGGRSDSIH